MKQQYQTACSRPQASTHDTALLPLTTRRNPAQRESQRERERARAAAGCDVLPVLHGCTAVLHRGCTASRNRDT
eukprot:1958135-Rhodomonas_salina.3